MTTAEFESVHVRTKRLIAETGVLAPSKLAQMVLNELGDSVSDLRAALAETLPYFCQKSMARIRQTAADTRPETPDPRPALINPTPIRKHHSPKVDSIRTWYVAFLAASLHIGGNVHKPIGLCTEQDLRFAAEERRSQAGVLHRKASEFERLADALRSCDVATVGELPAEVALEAFQRRAS